MVSKTTRKLIVSLQKRKTREDERKFIIEGDKIVNEFLAAGTKVSILVAKPEFINQLGKELLENVNEVLPATYEELKTISSLKTPHNALAVIEMPVVAEHTEPETDEYSIVLDCIQDPGNLGTIIRAAAWFGIKKVFCSPDSVDVFNPKVIQASMGAILSVVVTYTPLKPLIESALKRNIPVYGALLEGAPIYKIEKPVPGLLVFGNESKGISEELEPFITKKITIPRFGKTIHGVESLNVGMAASIVISEFMGRRF